MVSLVQLWEAVGTCKWDDRPVVVEVSHTGFFFCTYSIWRVGTGTPYSQLFPKDATYPHYHIALAGNGSADRTTSLANGSFVVRINGSVATDLNYTDTVYILLRSLQ